MEALIGTSEVEISASEVAISASEALIRASEVTISTPEALIRALEVAISTSEVLIRASEVAISTSEVLIRSSEVAICTSEVNSDFGGSLSIILGEWSKTPVSGWRLGHRGLWCLFAGGRLFFGGPAGEAGGEVAIDGFGFFNVLFFGVFDAAVEHQAGGVRLAAG